MKKLLLALFMIFTVAKGQAESQVVYFPASFQFSEEVKSFINESVKHFCSVAIKNSTIIKLVGFEVAYDEVEEGVVKTFIKAMLEVEYTKDGKTNDTITVIVNDADLENPQFPSLSLKGLESSGGVCRD